MTHPGGRDSLSRDTWCWFVIPGGWSSAVWYDSVGGWEWWLIQGVISRVLSHESCLIALGVESHIWYRASSSVFMRHDSLSWCYHNTLNRWFRVVTDTGRSFLYDVSWVRDWYRAFFSVWRVMSSWLIQGVLFCMTCHEFVTDTGLFFCMTCHDLWLIALVEESRDR